jgi:hypothetical protein
MYRHLLGLRLWVGPCGNPPCSPLRHRRRTPHDHLRKVVSCAICSGTIRCPWCCVGGRCWSFSAHLGSCVGCNLSSFADQLGLFQLLVPQLRCTAVKRTLGVPKRVIGRNQGRRGCRKCRGCWRALLSPDPAHAPNPLNGGPPCTPARVCNAPRTRDCLGVAGHQRFHGSALPRTSPCFNITACQPYLTQLNWFHEW